jgi:hypothetical protein
MNRRRQRKREDRDRKITSVFAQLRSAGRTHGFEYNFVELGDATKDECSDIPDAVDPSFAHARIKGGRAARKRQQMGSLVRYVRLVYRDGDTVVEFGAGAGHLGIILAFMFPTIHVVLVEPREISVNQAKERIECLGLSNCEVHHGMVDSFAEQLTKIGKSFQLGVSLHSCGFLTDQSFQLCAKHCAGYVLCPCCYGQVGEGNVYPRSARYSQVVTKEDFSSVCSGADFTVRAGDWNFTTSENWQAAKRCMQAIDLDRLAYTEELIGQGGGGGAAIPRSAYEVWADDEKNKKEGNKKQAGGDATTMEIGAAPTAASASSGERGEGRTQEGIVTALASMSPLNCSPKNNVIIMMSQTRW